MLARPDRATLRESLVPLLFYLYTIAATWIVWRFFTAATIPEISYGFGPITVNGSIMVFQNPGPYGYAGPQWTVSTTYNAGSDSIQDVDYLGYHISAGWKISDMLTLQAGYGWQEQKRSPIAGTEVADVTDDQAMYYINMPIFAAQGFTIAPEIGVRDEGNSNAGTGSPDVNDGDTTWYGVRWNIRF